MKSKTKLQEETDCYECEVPFSAQEWEDRHEEHAEYCTEALDQVGWCDCDVRLPVHAMCCGDCQGRGFIEENRLERGHFFYPRAVERAAIPALYATEHQPLGERTVHLRYLASRGLAAMWLLEYDPKTGDAFGYVNLGDTQSAEWGLFNLPEMELMFRSKTFLEVVLDGQMPLYIERDLSWTPKRVDQCDLPGRGMTLS